MKRTCAAIGCGRRPRPGISASPIGNSGCRCGNNSLGARIGLRFGASHGAIEAYCLRSTAISSRLERRRACPRTPRANEEFGSTDSWPRASIWALSRAPGWSATSCYCRAAEAAGSSHTLWSASAGVGGSADDCCMTFSSRRAEWDTSKCGRRWRLRTARRPRCSLAAAFGPSANGSRMSRWRSSSLKRTRSRRAQRLRLSRRARCCRSRARPTRRDRVPYETSAPAHPLR